MNFLVPGMLVGLLGAAIPVAIHLIGRRRAPTKKFGAIHFLLGSKRRIARYVRVRALLLLIFRVLACTAIALVLAQPFTSCSSTGPAVTTGPQAVVLLVDNSFVMGHRGAGQSLLERAKAQAHDVLKNLGHDADVAVLTTVGDQRNVELSKDHDAVGRGIDDIKLAYLPADTASALARASVLLAGAEPSAHRLYLFSGMFAGSFPRHDPGWGGDAPPELHVVDVSTGRKFANLAVTDLSARSDAQLGSRGLRVAGVVSNFSDVQRTTTMTLAVNGRAVARGVLSIEPGETATKNFAITLRDGANDTEVSVAIETKSSELAIDDVRYLRVSTRRQVRVLVVNGAPNTDRHQDETYYLETALRPGDRGDSGVALTGATVDELASHTLSDFDVIFLCNAKALDAALAEALREWVELGGGLFVSVGDNVDAEDYNATMSGVLPQTLRSLREIAPGAPRSEKEGRAARLERFRSTHPVFTVFSKDAVALRKAKFWRLFLLGPSARIENRRALAHFTDGAPALVEARVGEGRILLFTSTLDRDWNDFPIHPSYLPFLQQSTQFLAKTHVEDSNTKLLVGQSTEIPVASDVKRLLVTVPGGRKAVFEGERWERRQAVRFDETAVPGFYRIEHLSKSGVDSAATSQLGFVVNLDPLGSDTRRVSSDRLPTAAKDGGGSDPDTVSGQPKRRVDLWHGVAAMLVFLLLGESFLTRRG